MMRSYASSSVTLAGVLGFVVIVTYLQESQAGYDPVHQLMSELALGRHGFLMLWAFLSIAASVAAATRILAVYEVHPATRLILGIASLSLAGAGVFELGAATTVHLTLIALAFVLLVLSMYLIPRITTAFQQPTATAACWGLAAGTVLFVGLGLGPLPTGLAQRFTAGCVLLWLSWLAIFNLLQRHNRGI